MKVCAACGEKGGKDDKFCRVCGGRTIDKAAAPESAVSAEAASDRGPDKKVIVTAAVAVLLAAAVSIFLFLGGWDYIFGKPKPPMDLAADGQAPQSNNEPQAQSQTPENITQTTGAPAPGAKKKMADRSVSGLEGRWEGTYNAGYQGSGSCTATITPGRHVSICYDSRITGRVLVDKGGSITFEGPNTEWACKVVNQRGSQTLRCSYTVKGGTSGTSTGSLVLYKTASSKSGPGIK
jgi:hypothetical protein